MKNLETVQGDERDVMIFSIGYGPDQAGKFTMNFGPINNEGGWRRLNVAVTRARYRNEIVASFTPGQISDSTQRGVTELKTYLDYAMRGLAALELNTEGSLGGPESPFEESVVSWLRSQGYLVTTQVGSSGYRIDMAIQDPQQTSRFVLGIECDGVAYHGSKTARDRDRLREEVLVGLGWKLHRIWGTAWYRHRQDEQARLKLAIDQALRVKPQGLLARPTKAQARPAVEVEEVVWGETSEWAVPYVVSSPPGPPRNIDPSQASAVPYLRRTIEAVVEQESPVHKDIVDARVLETWGFARIGANIRTQMDAAISSSKSFHVDKNGFMYVGNLEGELPTRTHDEWHKRDIKHIHQRELEDTAFRIVCEAAAISFDDLVMASARNFGFTRVGPDIRDAIGRAVRSLQESGWITSDDDQRIRSLAE